MRLHTRVHSRKRPDLVTITFSTVFKLCEDKKGLQSIQEELLINQKLVYRIHSVLF